MNKKSLRSAMPEGKIKITMIKAPGYIRDSDYFSIEILKNKIVEKPLVISSKLRLKRN